MRMCLKLFLQMAMLYTGSYSYQCVCNNYIEPYKILAEPYPVLHNSPVVGVAYKDDCFFYNGTEVYDNRTFWKTDVKGTVGWFWILNYDEPHLQNCSNPIRDVKEDANCLLVMTSGDVYAQPYETLYYQYMHFGSCRGPPECPSLNSKETFTMNNKTWFNVSYMDRDVAYVLADQAIRWHCTTEPANGPVPVWEVAFLSFSGFVFLCFTLYVWIIRKRRNSKIEWLNSTEDNFEGNHFNIEYDVFLSYSRADWEWVKNTLFQKLLDEGYSICIDFKDFVPGMEVSENIMNSIYNSKKTIIIMSKNYMKSMWGQFELQQAHYRAIAQRKDTIILIKFGKCRVPKTLLGKTFLDWTSKKEKSFFWKRLFKSIGKPSNYPKMSDML